jgi:hypothetical protein
MTHRHGGSTSGGFPTGPALTPKEKAERDRGEAAKAREEAAKAREEAKKAAEEAERDEERAAADRKRHEYKDARKEMREARGDLARERRDLVRAGRDMARSRRDLGRARTAGQARPARGGGWVLGGNDRYATCVAAAVANSLLLATGQRASDEDVLGLHVAAAGRLDAEASVRGVLLHAPELVGEAVQPHWRVLEQPVWDAEAAHVAVPATPPGEPARFPFAAVHDASVILELALPGGRHAALLGDGFAVTWGEAVPVTEAFLASQVVAAWAVTWDKRTERSV